MSYYPPGTPQSYPQFQAAYPPYPTQFQGQFPSQPPFPTSQPSLNASSSPPPDPPSPLQLSAVTSDVAAKSIQRLVSLELRNAGFDAAEPYALDWLEREVVAFVDELFKFAHDYANHSNRAGPIAKDLVLACKRFGVEPKEMYEVASQWKKRRRDLSEPEVPTLEPAPARSPSPELLPSDDEDQPPLVPATLRALPHHLPALPPKHTYLRTPASPPKKAALPSLEKKLKTASQDDGELLGAVVNWEATTHPRKRWKPNWQTRNPFDTHPPLYDE